MLGLILEEWTPKILIIQCSTNSANVYMVVFLFNTLIYVVLLLCLYILIVCLCIFLVPVGTLRLPWLRFFRAFSSIVRQMPGYNSQRRDTARTLPKHFVLFHVLFHVFFVLCRSVYCLCANMYCTTATGWQPNCSLRNISYHILYHIISECRHVYVRRIQFYISIFSDLRS
jgi:hypothetical protein